MNARKNLKLKLDAIQNRVGQTQGKRFWPSLDELANTEAFQELMRGEFPAQTDIWPESLSRRKFLGLMGASLALAGLGGCYGIQPAPVGEIVPYSRPPEEVVPGEPLFFATTMTHAGAGVGLLVESHEGRPTKIEGNPDHPASRGATDVYHQASVLTLYDPDRAKTVTFEGATRTWDEFLAAVRPAMEKHRKNRGGGLRILTETVVSPTLARQIQDLLKEMPEAKWHVWEPIHNDMARHASNLAFGESVDVMHDFSKADVVLSLDADFLQCGASNLNYPAQFMERRRVRENGPDSTQAKMNRMYMVETAVSCTGTKADHRLPLEPRDIVVFALALAARLGVSAADLNFSPPDKKWQEAVAKDLEAHRGRSLVIAGPRQPPTVHLLAHILNERLGNLGQTVTHIDTIDFNPIDRTQSLSELVKDMEQKKVESLFIFGSNPVYAAPADIAFAKHMSSVSLRVHHSLFVDETSYLCQWHLPAAHYLEMWSDARAYDGSASIVQPLIEPLYQGRSMHEVLALMANYQAASGRTIVRDHWRQEAAMQQQGPQQGIGFQERWQSALHKGVIPNTAFKPRPTKLKEGWEQRLREAAKFDSPKTLEVEAAGPKIAFLPDPTLYDGEFANNGWLQELPKPVTKLAWGNAAMMSPATARKHGIRLGDYAHGGEHGGFYMPVVELTLLGRSVKAPAWIVPGMADNVIGVYLGNGRTRAGRVGGNEQETIGFDAYQLRTSQRPWFADGVVVANTSATELVACTQQHQLMDNREPVRSATLEEFHAHPQFATEPDREKLHEEEQTSPAGVTMYKPVDYGPPKHKWGMFIDLTACVGCQACIVACQSENNIPVVGKEQVAAGREMHWLRVDRYVSGTGDDPQEAHFQPVPCMHCENAPCEYVCPVEATLHSAEGLNEMIYQRCVGTRFCSNNCPYKVRRFNFLAFTDNESPSRRLQFNPDVTVRSRGVMEKCSYCVQRIRHAEMTAEKEKRPIADGEVLTACQAVCPTQAIVFGDINDPKSKVKEGKDSPLNYGLLSHLNTYPRTTYLAALRNPNPELEAPLS